MLCFGLKPTTGCIGSGVFCKCLWCRSLSGTACDWHWSTKQSIVCGFFFLAWVGVGMSNLHMEADFHQPEPRDRSARKLKAA